MRHGISNELKKEGRCTVKKKLFYYLSITGLVVVGILIVGCGEGGAVRLEGPREALSQSTLDARCVIEIKAQGEILRYRKEFFYSEEYFSKIRKSRERFISKEINTFRRNLERYKRRAVNPKLEFSETEKSTILMCKVEGAKEGSRYLFDWLLKPLGLDFVESNFEETEKELYWEGKTSGVKTAISIKFPFVISTYNDYVCPE